jgi:hypothetical protein
MRTLTAPPIAESADLDAQALFEEARRRRRRRRQTIGVVGVVLLVVTPLIVAATSYGKPGVAHRNATPRLLGLLANKGAYVECPGSAHVGPQSAPDFLPAAISGTDNLSFVVSVAEEMTDGSYLGLTHQVAGLPVGRDVRAVRVAPGGGWVWSRSASGQIRVIPVKNYGIYVYLKETARCPTGGWVRLVNNGVQVTFLMPER